MGIKFTQVNYAYSDSKQIALKDIDLLIHTSDEKICLVGETGSGKSTLVKHMNALVQPKSGEVRIFGVSVTSKKRTKADLPLNPLRQKVGLVFQFPDYQLFEESVLKDVAFGPKNFGFSNEEAIIKAKEALALVGLDESFYDRVPFTLSGGEKKKVSIAGILALNPDMLILDEPTSGLDPQSKTQLLELFETIYKKTHKTMIMITHDMNIVYRHASRVIVMDKGEIAFDGEPYDLFKYKDISKYHLMKPDLLLIQEALEKKFKIESKTPLKTKDSMIDFIKEVIS
jgi:energy-coupling factor transport system ATP-binding protein